MRTEKKFANNFAVHVPVFVCIMAAMLMIAPASHAAFSTLHEFITSGSDGAFPHGSLTLSGSTLYGTTSEGGSGGNQNGTVFKIGTDGNGYLMLHSFSVTDGSVPNGSLTLYGSTLYGTTSEGGVYDNGAIFQINTDGSGFNVLHSFAGGSDGAVPQGSLTLVGSTLLGMTSAQGGAGGLGTIFMIGVNGTGYTVLHNFSQSDGSGPNGSLILSASGSTLYGMTALEGADYGGTIFSIGVNGNGYTVLHNFSQSDGTTPYGDLTLSASGSTLYGTASIAGPGNYGTIFQIGTDGNNFQVLHSFSWSDGVTPTGSLTLSGSTLYGMTSVGGTGGYGTIFQMNTDGSGYQVLHDFNGNDGGAPAGSLTLSESTLYGTTMQYGGGASAAGTVFSMTIGPNPGAPIASFTANPSSGAAPLAVTFTDTSTGSPTGWAWSFGDEATSQIRNPKHTYSTAGYYTATLTASNAAGSSSASKTITVNSGGPTVPAAPTIISVTPGNAQATVNFTLPYDGGSPIKSYTAASSPGKKQGKGAGSPIAVKGLSNGTSYTFTVTATNKIGTGPASSPSSPVTPATLPGPPKNVKAAVGTETGTVIVTFNPPSSNGGSSIISYAITSPQDSTVNQTGSSSPINVTGLKSGTKYTFKAAATNAVGTGPASSPSNSVTPK